MKSLYKLIGELSGQLDKGIPLGTSGFTLTSCPVLLQNLRGRGSSYPEVAGSWDEGLYLLLGQH